MADAVTPFYNWAYPTNGADATTWGTTLNTTLIAIDAQVRANAVASVPSASPTFTGNAVFSAVSVINGADTTTGTGNYGVRIRAATGGGSAIFQITDNAGAVQWGVMNVASNGGAFTFSNAVTATGFNGALSGNVTGNVSGSSGSCTGNAATATTAGTATNATTATTATNLSGGSVSATTFTASGAMTKGSAGGIPYLVAGTDTGGAITISTLAPSGTPANGDVWLQHA